MVKLDDLHRHEKEVWNETCLSTGLKTWYRRACNPSVALRDTHTHALVQSAGQTVLMCLSARALQSFHAATHLVLHVLINIHYGCLVTAAVAIIGCTEHCDNCALVLPQETL